MGYPIPNPNTKLPKRNHHCTNIRPDRELNPQPLVFQATTYSTFVFVRVQNIWLHTLPLGQRYQTVNKKTNHCKPAATFCKSNSLAVGDFMLISENLCKNRAGREGVSSIDLGPYLVINRTWLILINKVKNYLANASSGQYGHKNYLTIFLHLTKRLLKTHT